MLSLSSRVEPVRICLSWRATKRGVILVGCVLFHAPLDLLPCSGLIALEKGRVFAVPYLL